GKSVEINLCILAMTFTGSGERLIPYKIDEKGMLWGAHLYSAEVKAYEGELADRFRLPRQDDEAVAQEASRRARENWTSGLGYLAVGLACFWAVVWGIGWIVRGFLGIPRGMDKRPDTSSQPRK